MAENIIVTSVGTAMRKNYIDYAMSVITERALANVYDGLKPVQRRILYDALTLGLTPDKPYKKCARTVGDVLGKYHPHGDTSVYEAMVKMAQNFTMRYPLVDGHGNFGSIDGDGAAAMRYTESKLTRYGQMMMKDINKNTVDFVPNFDGEEQEPVVLSTLLPNALLNGSVGIAVGMAANLAPHNINDVYNALDYIIDCAKEGIDPEEDTIINYVQAPDFPTGGTIVNIDSVREAYKTGQGKCLVRGTYNVEDDGTIVITEIPYKVNKAKLVEKMYSLSKPIKEKGKPDKKAIIEGIKEIRDESDKTGIRIVVELKKDTNPQLVLNGLLKHSDLQCNFSINNTLLVDGEPKVVSLFEMMNSFLKHSAEVTLRKSQFDIDKGNKRLNIVMGVIKCIEDEEIINAVINAIRHADDAVAALIELGFNKAQAEYISEMKIKALSNASYNKLSEERQELEANIARLNNILNDDIALLDEIKLQFNELREMFSDERRTAITNDSASINEEDLVADEKLLITITNTNMIKSVEETEYNTQKRGGKGSKATTTKDDEIVKYLFSTNSKDNIMFFTNLGRVHLLKAYKIPKANKNARGKSIFNFLSLDTEKGEEIVNVIAANTNDTTKSLLLATKNGIIKRLQLDKLSTRMSVTKVIEFREGDSLTAVLLVSENDNVVLNTSQGMSIRIEVTQESIRPSGRTATGVKGTSLKSENDYVVDMSLCNKDYLFTLTESGLGKKTALDEYKKQGRGGSGIVSHKITEKTGCVIAASTVSDNEDIFIITKQGLMVRIQASDIATSGRNTSGVKLVTLNENDEIASITVTEHIDNVEEEVEE